MVSTPTCDETASLSEVWLCFQQAEVDQLVVLNDQQFPLGLLRLCRLLPFFSPNSPYLSRLSQMTLAEYWTLLDPISVSWEETEVAQLQTQLATLSQQTIVLVNASGQYAGRLDQLQILQHLASRPTGRLTDSDPTLPEPLVDLLEHLPLPLMLQTASGRLITQNLAWRQQVGAIQQPQRIHRAAARVLEVALTCKTKPRASAAMSSRKRGSSSAALNPPGNSTLQKPLEPAAVSTPSDPCRLGAEPNVCICVCPMKEGQDRVWQFIRIPMGLPTEAASQGLTEPVSPWSVTPFKLAPLKFSPDSSWRTLLQTEALWLVLAQDVTEQQQVAKELTARNADLVQLNRLKDEFLACISHELKTPLTAVLGMSSLLKDQLLGELNERQAHYAQLIYRSGRHLIAIVNNILDLTRIETGQLELSLEPLHIPSLCQQAYEQAQQQLLVETNAESSLPLPAAEHPFELEIQPDLQYMVADELRLRQMLINLIANAIKFTQPDSAIGLRVESWEGWIAFTVWDTGIGIPPEKQHLIFQKFQQLEPPLTRQFRGTGLGLVLTQRLARLHGGDISFTSVPGKGSEFTLLLPPVPPQASDFSVEVPCLPQPALMQTEHNRLVLIVEIDAEQLDIRVGQLTELGCRAVVARSGTEAIEKARRLQPAAILLNSQLPLLSGWDVVTLLKADETTRKIPIVMTASRVERNQAYQHGVDQFLSLPVDLSTLEHCLDQLIVSGQPELPDAMTDLTVLHLCDGNPSLTLISEESAVSQELNHLLYPYHCRVLEVDDLDQANLLARVWKPDVVLIDQMPPHPQQFMRQLSQASFLAELPLITLSTEVTQAANQIPGLTVFPYLAQTSPNQTQVNLAELVQVIQLAVGIHWTPQILIVDCSPPDLQSPIAVRPPVRALMQYLQTAGFQSAINNDWQKVQLQLQHQGVDLLLLCVSLAEPQSVVEQVVQTLQHLLDRPPILVWNYQAPDQADVLSDATSFNLWNRIAAEVLPASLPISELLNHINQRLTRQRQPT